MVPGIAFAVGLSLVVVVMRHWRQPAVAVPASGPAASPEVLERARREIEREMED
jgi:hypothetical protein